MARRSVWIVTVLVLRPSAWCEDKKLYRSAGDHHLALAQRITAQPGIKVLQT